eukprot:6429514-Heterocapsa_arctica.AAC.1
MMDDWSNSRLGASLVVVSSMVTIRADDCDVKAEVSTKSSSKTTYSGTLFSTCAKCCVRVFGRLQLMAACRATTSSMSWHWSGVSNVTNALQMESTSDMMLK